MRKLKLPGRTKEMPRLNDTDYRLVQEQGIQEIKDQARKIVRNKLEEQPDNDGVQTPKAGNPIYKAMHACRCSSRRELSRAHRIPAGRKLSESEIEAVVNLLTRWIAREYNFFTEEEQMQKSLGEFSRK
ncbi:DUF4186 family protein [Candidatus Nanosalina sp. VS9-1]|uniref:DUF4186 family protein n=1 Tax=Candidatus Nanosalina sp. VS9-1 TaxID=3388566 RepID=UPI0039E1BCF2